ncbi:TPA: tetratricopeptide repeat protein [Serratia marcescens]|nr:hypothetical protein [Serratia marcescens]
MEMDTLIKILELLKWPIAFIVASLIFRKPLVNLVNKLERLKYNKGDSCLEATITPSTEVTTEKAIAQSTTIKTVDEPTIDRDDDKNDDIQTTNWIDSVNYELKKPDIDGARKAFEQSRKECSSENEFYMRKSIFLYLIYDKTHNEDILNELENHIKDAKTEEQAADASIWYVMCLEMTKQYKVSISFLLKQLQKLKNPEQITATIVSLSDSYLLDSEPEKAKKIIIQRLGENLSNKDYSLLYSKLSEIEESLGNGQNAALCLDKAVEYSPNDKELFFNSAYKASKNDLPAIEISNYDILTFIDPENSLALNNLGVSADTIKLESIAARYFEKASNLGNTLAMSNNGLKLLNAGLINQAESLINKALEDKSPHKNVYSLLTKIKEKKEKDDNKWADVKNNAFNLQKKLRAYTHCLYKRDENNILTSGWVVDGDTQAKLEMLDITSFKIEFENKNKTINIVGNVQNLSLNGVYIEKPKGQESNSMLTREQSKSISVFGYYNHEDDKLVFFPKKADDELNLVLSREIK